MSTCNGFMYHSRRDPTPCSHQNTSNKSMYCVQSVNIQWYVVGLLYNVITVKHCTQTSKWTPRAPKWDIPSLLLIMQAKLWVFPVDSIPFPSLPPCPSGHGLVILGRRDRQGCPADGLIQNLLHQIVEMFQEKWKLWFLGTSCVYFLVSLRLEDLQIPCLSMFLWLWFFTCTPIQDLNGYHVMALRFAMEVLRLVFGSEPNQNKQPKLQKSCRHRVLDVFKVHVSLITTIPPEELCNLYRSTWKSLTLNPFQGLPHWTSSTICWWTF